MICKSEKSGKPYFLPGCEDCEFFKEHYDNGNKTGRCIHYEMCRRFGHRKLHFMKKPVEENKDAST